MPWRGRRTWAHVTTDRGRRVGEGARTRAGFGLSVPGEAHERARVSACRAVARGLKGEAFPGADPALLEALSLAKGLFNRVVRQDQADWFVTQARLGFPSGRRCVLAADALAACRSAAKAGDARAWDLARALTRRARVRKALSAYRGLRRLPACPGSGFAYVMSRREDPDLLVVGVTEAHVLDAAAAVNAARPDAPLGVRASWWVSDVDLAEAVIQAAMDGRDRLGGDAWRAGFDAVRRAVEGGLAAEGIVMDPFRQLEKVPPRERRASSGPGACAVGR